MGKVMTHKELADKLARLAGWKPTKSGLWHGPGGVLPMGSHPFPVGSFDALEDFRQEELPNWVYWEASSNGPTALYRFIFELSASPDLSVKGTGPDEWFARASAFVAARRRK